MTVIITGAAGCIGMALRERLAPLGHTLRLVDIADQPPARDGERVEIIKASVTDIAAMTKACEGASAVVHLAGYPGEETWQYISGLNLDGTAVMLEAAQKTGVTRFVFASSNHAAGFRTRDEADQTGLPDDVAFEPDTFYGVAKAAGEALGRLYHRRFGMNVICLRIGTCMARPENIRALSTWLSLDDCARLVDASLSDNVTGFHTVWGVSANTRRWWSTTGGDAIGYRPLDDAETFADDIPGAHDPVDLAAPTHRFVGGPFTQHPLGTV